MNSWLLEVWRVWTLWGSRLTFVIRDIQNNASTKQLKMMLQYKLFSTPTKFKTMCYSSILHKSPGLLCTCLCANSDRSSLWALFQSCFSLSIFPGARINKHRWVKGKKKHLSYAPLHSLWMGRSLANSKVFTIITQERHFSSELRCTFCYFYCCNFLYGLPFNIKCWDRFVWLFRIL